MPNTSKNEQTKKQTAKARQTRKPCKQRYNGEMRWIKNKRKRMIRRLKRMLHRNAYTQQELNSNVRIHAMIARLSK